MLDRRLLYGTALAALMGPVSATITLGTLTLSGPLNIGAASTGSIIGASPGSTITKNVPGLTVNSGARTYSWDGNGSVGTVSNGLTETLAGAVGNPKDSPLTVASAAPSIPAPNLNWRLQVIDAASANATFRTDSIAASDANKIFPKRSYTAGTYTEAWKVGDIAAPGGFLYFLFTNGIPSSVTVEQSLNSTDGLTDGTWSALTVRKPSTSAGLGKPCVVSLPQGTGNRWIRMTNVLGGSAAMYVKLHQRSATGRDFVVGALGTSKESACWQSLDVWNEIKRLEALSMIPVGSDPIFFEYTTAAAEAIELAGNVGGVGYATTTTGLLGQMIAAAPEITIVLPGSMGAVDSRLLYEKDLLFENAPAQDIKDLQTGFHSCNLQCAAANITVIHGGPDYRNAKSTTGFEVGGYAHPERGVLPYYVNVIVPLVAADTPYNFDSNRNTTKFCDYYSTAWRWHYTGSDGDHQTDTGNNVERRERVIGVWNLLLTGAPPHDNLIERTITKAEASLDYWDYWNAYGPLSAMPESTGRTDALARLAAIASSIKSDCIRVAMAGVSNTSVPVWPADATQFPGPGWNVPLGRIATGVKFDPTTSPLQWTDLRSATGYGFSIESITGTVSISGGGMKTAGYDEEDFPDIIVEGTLQLGSGEAMTVSFNVPNDDPHTVELLSTAGISTSAGNSKVISMTVNGSAKTRNPGSADTNGNKTLDVWTGVTRSAGKITIDFAPNAGSSGAYIPQVIRLTRNGASSITLGNLSLSSTSSIEDTLWTATITGKTAGSTVTATSSDATVLAVTGTSISGTFTTPGTPSITLHEVLGGATNTPHDTPAIGFTVSAAPTLGTLSLDNLSGNVGTQFVGILSGKTAGSSVTATDLTSGTAMAVTDYGDRIEVTGTFAATGTKSVRLRETLNGAANGPDHDTTVSVDISAAVDTTPDAFSFTDQTGVAQSSTITSNTITVAGITAAASITISGGTYKINSGSYVSSSGTVNNGDSVTMRVTSSASYSTGVSATLNIGGVTDTFSATTLADPGASYDTDAQAFFDASTDPLTTTEKDAINAMVASLKSGSYWTRFDHIFCRALASTDGWLKNIRDPSRNSTNVGATHTAGLGVKGASAQYVSYGRQLRHSGSQFDYTSGFAFAFCNATNTTINNGVHMGQESASRTVLNVVTSTASNESYKISDSVTTTARQSTGKLGRRAIARSGGTKEYDFNGVNIAGATATTTTGTSATGNHCIHRADSTYSTDTIWLDGSGAYFSASERSAIDGIFVTLAGALSITP